jgi:hypothetical protein
MSKEWLRNPWLLLALIFSATPANLSAQENTAPPALPSPSAQPQPSARTLGTLLRPLKLNELTLREQAQAIPQEKKDRVHFFLINGLDPLQASNLHGVAGYFRSIGFANTSSYQFPSTWKVRRQIETLRRSDPEARIVLLGFSVGANCVRGLANNLQRDGIYLDCLVYVSGDTVFNSPSSRPPNVGQIVNITGHGLVFLGRDLYFKGDDIDGAVNHRLDARHMNIPAGSDTINLVGKELIALANKSSTATDQAPTVEAPAETPLATPAIVAQPRRFP